MKYLLCIFSIAFLWSCDQKNDNFFMPAEWEPHEAVWLGWEADTTARFYPSIGEIITTLKPHITVKIAFDSDSLKQTAIEWLIDSDVDTTGIIMHVMPGERYWIRDHGATFLINERGELGAADFGWDLYGMPAFLDLQYEGNRDSVNVAWNDMKESIHQTGRVDSLMAAATGATVLKTEVIHEGGAVEVNGKGTLILNEESVFLRNPDLSKEFIEAEFKRVLGVTNIIWTKQGLANDPHWFIRRITGDYIGGGTGGHVDQFVRFANSSTILLAWVDENEKYLNPVNQMNYERMNENYQILRNARDQDGNLFEIVKVPLPDLITEQVIVRQELNEGQFTLDVKHDWFVPSEAAQVGDTLQLVAAASYLNYFVTNGLVLLPTYTASGSSKEKEDAVRAIFEQQFPEREIVFIDTIMQNWLGGGIHCSVQQQPKITKR